MLVKDFFKWAKEEFEEEMKIMGDKGREYTVHDKDKLKNFKFIAERLDLPPTTVAMVYLLKHLDSIRNYVQEGTEASDEPISGRFRDARIYLFLLLALVIDDNK